MRVHLPPLQDPEAFSDLYNRTQIIIFRFIYGLHGGPVEEVEDLTCDTFLRAWRGRTGFVGDDHEALCWLFTIARRLVIDAHRHRKVHASGELVSLDEANFMPGTISSDRTLEDQADDREQFKRLWSRLQQLPDDRREMLVLRYMLGWKVNEIADYLKKEENTISVYIKRSLEQIRSQWAIEE